MADSEIHSTTFLFLEAFANLITIYSSHKNDLVARTGSYSIHFLISQIVPEVRTDFGIFQRTPS